MNEKEFDELIQDLHDNYMPIIIESVGKFTIEQLAELKQNGLSGDQLAAVLATSAACEASFRTMITILNKVYKVHPDPDDWRKHIKLVKG